MKSATSFFNKTVLKKDLTRFWPVWVLTSILFLLVVSLTNYYSPENFARRISYTMATMFVFNLLYGWVCAMLLLGDLFRPRLCNGAHAMPLRREAFLLTHITAGLLFFLIPNGVLCLVLSLLLQKYYVYALMFFAVSLLQFICFFGIAVFSALCSGKSLGMSAVYWITLLFPELLYWFGTVFYQPRLPGILLYEDDFLRFSPLSSGGRMCLNMGYLLDDVPTAPPVTFSNWVYLLCAAGAGILLMGAAFLLYRRRKLECAGDFITLKPAKPIFLVLYTLSAGALLHSMANFVARTTVPFLIIGLIIGYFTGRMLLERSVRVFYKKSLIGAVIFAAVLGLTTLVIQMDPLGVARYVPEPENVRSVTIRNPEYESYYSYFYGSGVTLTEPEEIARVTQMHKSLIGTDAQEAMPLIYLEYRTTGGRITRRYYRIPAGSEAFAESKFFFSQPELVLNCTSKEEFISGTGMIEVTNLQFPAKGLEELKNAIYQDCLDGNMVQNDLYHRTNTVVLRIYCYGSSTYNGTYFKAYSDAVNTRRVIEKYAPELLGHIQ